MKHFIKEGKIENNSIDSVAKFLFENDLDKFAKGYIFSTMSSDLLESYMNLFEMASKLFTDCFRKFFSSFILPPKSKIYDKVISVFANHYNTLNSLTKDTDHLYLLTWNMIILHNDLHYKKDKITIKNNFINSCQRINKDFSNIFLDEIYEDILREKIYDVIPCQRLMTTEQNDFYFEEQRKSNKKDDLFFIFSEMFTNRETVIDAFITSSSKTPKTFFTTFQNLHSFFAIDRDFKNMEKVEEFLINGFAIEVNNEEKMKELCRSLFRSCSENTELIKNWWNILNCLSIYTNKTSDASFIDSIIKGTHLMSRDNIMNFINSYIDVCRKNLCESHPKTILVTKMNLFFKWNAERPLYIWIEYLWPPIKNFLTNSSVCSDINIAKPSILSLTNCIYEVLSFKCMGMHKFQYFFMSPLLEIFDQQTNAEARSAILNSLIYIITKKSKYIKSGWDIIFQILSLAASESFNITKCSQIADIICETCIDTIKHFIIHFISFLSLLICNCKNEKEMINNCNLFAVISQNLKHKNEEIYNCLVENVHLCCLKCGDIIIDKTQNVMISILEDFPCLNFFDDKMFDVFEASKTNDKNLQQFLSTVVKNDIYDKYWRKILELLVNACEANQISLTLFTEYCSRKKALLKDDLEFVYCCLKQITTKRIYHIDFISFIKQMIEAFKDVDEHFIYKLKQYIIDDSY